MIEMGIITHRDEIESIKPEWQELLGSLEKSPPFWHPSWVLNWVDQNALSSSLFFLVFRMENKLIGLLPLYTESVFGVCKLRYCSDTLYPDPLGLIALETYHEDCYSLLFIKLLERADWDIMTLPWFYKHEASLIQGEMSITTKQPYLELPDSIEDYLSGFKKKKRYNLKRLVKNFFSDGGEFSIASNNTEKKEYLKSLFSIHEDRASERGIESTFTGGKLFELHNSLLDKLESAELYRLKMNGETIAILYGFKTKTTFYYYQIAHLPKYGDLSPGVVVLFKTMEYLISRDVKEFNFLQGDEAYKSYWTKSSRNLYTVVTFNTTFKAKVYKTLSHLMQALKTLLRKGQN